MPVKIITDFGMLMKKAHRLGKAKMVKTPNQEEQRELMEAKRDHDAYKEICLKADQITL